VDRSRRAAAEPQQSSRALFPTHERMLLDENAGGRDESHKPSTRNVSVLQLFLALIGSG